MHAGDLVVHPTTGQTGTVVRTGQNPACLMRWVVVRWEDGEEEELEAIEFGPLEDD